MITYQEKEHNAIYVIMMVSTHTPLVTHEYVNICKILPAIFNLWKTWYEGAEYKHKLLYATFCSALHQIVNNLSLGGWSMMSLREGAGPGVVKSDFPRRGIWEHPCPKKSPNLTKKCVLLKTLGRRGEGRKLPPLHHKPDRKIQNYLLAK